MRGWFELLEKKMMSLLELELDRAYWVDAIVEV